MFLKIIISRKTHLKVSSWFGNLWKSRYRVKMIITVFQSFQ